MRCTPRWVAAPCKLSVVVTRCVTRRRNTGRPGCAPSFASSSSTFPGASIFTGFEEDGQRFNAMEGTVRLLVLLQFLVSAMTAEDFRHIAYEDLADSNLFQMNGVTSFSQLLFDVARQQVFVGARDNLFRLTLSPLTVLEHAPWTAPPEKATVCQDKGQSADDCHNYIKVVLSNGKSLFACGTNAFSPQCTWREIENINSVTTWMAGVAMCPYSPHANVTALLAMGPSGGLFAGAPTDFAGAHPAIYRTLATPILRTHQYDPRWLNDPQFVGSFETEDHVYFLFRESAVEYMNCGKKIYSRIARVCKNDPGGQTMMQDIWTTFSKARLNCSLPGEFPFYYDEIQGAAYQPEEGIVYATFTTPSNSIPGSAICAFNMSAISASFNGPYKHQENSGSAWERRPVAHRNRQHCGIPTTNAANQLLDTQRYQLMDDAVQGATLEPLHTTTMERFTHIAVDATPTKVHRTVTVLYVATTEGLVKKISVLPRTQETCVLEVWGPLPSSVRTLQFLKDTQSLYVGMENGLLRIPAAQCHRHRGRQACLNSQEPYCGWNDMTQKCAAIPSHAYLDTHWSQQATHCPVLTDPVDGGWSSWSAWAPCQHGTAVQMPHSHHGHNYEDTRESTDMCQCQTRECNNPPPKHGGAGCVGTKVRVSNCTVHGEWTAWSAWSECSQTCGFAMKTRRRTCGNPAPAFGGRVCVGYDHTESVCLELPPCPTPAKAAPPPKNGQWSQWSPWDKCSRPCGGGIRTRRRTCDNPLPSDGGAECPGCGFQIEDCNTHQCEDEKRSSAMTPWLPVNSTVSAIGYTEKRYRFSCRVQTKDPSGLRIQMSKEERYCNSDGSCLKAMGAGPSEPSEDGWGEWSSWTTCTRTCGKGIQHRIRQCESPLCESAEADSSESSKQSRFCNIQPCRESSGAGQWSCWTDWSECSVSCGIGVRWRTRKCLTSFGNDDEDEDLDDDEDAENGCEGPSTARETCEMPSCEYLRGWDQWSSWTPCNSEGQQHRKRHCLQEPCAFERAHETRVCPVDWMDNDISNALPRSVDVAGISVGAVVGGCISGFVIGILLAGALCFVYQKRRQPRVPGSPHYISKQNPYVTVPLKEVNTKRQPSFSGSTNGNGTLRTKNNPNVNGGLGSPKLYPKSLDYESATLKRNSHGQPHIRADLDQDKYY
ncbi:semaphorin-5B isoform X1 [Neodiprion lecontei]|uniref:Semaphorin-5B isoform X1 n=2 Tax=Neodiprion lecontei TaxID=441921 RepID=A0ABM3GIS0_NEOLC|nr:semaphorin-5B isoform X1 [Neodiprion lecontei]